VTVWIFEVSASVAIPVVEFAVVEAPGGQRGEKGESGRRRHYLIATLRLSIDSAQADALEGRAADLGRLIVATESLVKLLPSEPPKPESQREDPRVVLWRIIKEGRDRLAEGFEGYDGKVKQIEVLQAELAAKDAELAALKTGSAPPDVPLGGIMPHRGGSTVIDPSEADVCPPSEIGVALSGHVPGPDDPPPRSTRVIEAKANPPAAPRNWDDTDNGRKWQAWHDAGGPGFDRWADNRD
jgi:hypothetical protein